MISTCNQAQGWSHRLAKLNAIPGESAGEPEEEEEAVTLWKEKENEDY